MAISKESLQRKILFSCVELSYMLFLYYVFHSIWKIVSIYSYSNSFLWIYERLLNIFWIKVSIGEAHHSRSCLHLLWENVRERICSYKAKVSVHTRVSHEWKDDKNESFSLYTLVCTYSPEIYLIWNSTQKFQEL